MGVLSPAASRSAVTALNSCYSASMSSKALQEMMQRAESWPEVAQAELAQIAREIDAGLSAGSYHPTAAERDGIARGLNDARAGRFASDDEVRRVLEKRRPA